MSTLGLASWILFFHLLVLMCVDGDESVSGSKYLLSLHSKDVDETHRGHTHQVHGSHAHHPSSSHMDPSVLMVFFIMEDLRVGKVMPISFPNRTLSHVLPKQEADSIPFSLDRLPYLLRFFSFPQGSPQAQAMQDTLSHCETNPIKGETKLCATSLESVDAFTLGFFGSDTRVKMLTTTHITKPYALLQKYTVLEITQEIFAPKLVACHTMPYPYAVFYCHGIESDNRVFMVTLEGEDGNMVEALSVCHMDTSHWSRNHVSFNVLGVEPGTTPVCHFFPSDHFVFIPFSASM